ncbi:MAG TPA: twin-arginine translocation signal domain-containing protein [Candidatus Deferrimicrobiaceae bacterium]|nr:twin-arginine translocation signal domain-containing protein [Candidatus Deferrimicrobiaceae bacterium]
MLTRREFLAAATTAATLAAGPSGAFAQTPRLARSLTASG